jgi:TetR/AcrR family transcriptional regulator, tetracycline repressor protein
MSRAGRPRVHIHLSRDTIARAGLALIDRDGPEALTLRNLAVELGVGTTTLYGHVRSRDEIVTNIVALLLGEVDTAARSKEPWDDVLRRVAHSLREVVLRHPGAFTLIALAPVEDSPVVDYARAIAELSCAGGMSEEQFIESWQVVDPFLTGFLLMETAAVERGRQAVPEVSGSPSASVAFRRDMSRAHSDEAFAAALEVVITGLREKARDT